MPTTTTTTDAITILKESDVTVGESDVTVGQSDVTVGESDVTVGESDITVGESDITVGRTINNYDNVYEFLHSIANITDVLALYPAVLYDLTCKYV